VKSALPTMRAIARGRFFGDFSRGGETFARGRAYLWV
jgi:hypothetical protein